MYNWNKWNVALAQIKFIALAQMNQWLIQIMRMHQINQSFSSIESMINPNYANASNKSIKMNMIPID